MNLKNSLLGLISLLAVSFISQSAHANETEKSRSVKLLLSWEEPMLFTTRDGKNLIKECGEAPISCIPYFPKKMQWGSGKAETALRECHKWIEDMGGKPFLDIDEALRAMGGKPMPLKKEERAYVQLTCTPKLATATSTPSPRAEPDETSNVRLAEAPKVEIPRPEEDTFAWQGDLRLFFVAGSHMWFTPTEGIMEIAGGGGAGLEMNIFTWLATGITLEGGIGSDVNRRGWFGARVHVMWTDWPYLNAGLTADWQLGVAKEQVLRHHIGWGVRVFRWLTGSMDWLGFEAYTSLGRDYWSETKVEGGTLTSASYPNLGFGFNAIARF